MDFKQWRKDLKAHLQVGKDYITVLVSAGSARSKGCCLIAYTGQSIVGNITVLRRQVCEDSHAHNIPMSPLSSAYYSVSPGKYTKERWSPFLCYLSDLKSCICSRCISGFHSGLWDDPKNWTGFSKRTTHYHFFFGWSQDKFFLTESPGKLL